MEVAKKLEEIKNYYDSLIDRVLLYAIEPGGPLATSYSKTKMYFKTNYTHNDIVDKFFRVYDRKIHRKRTELQAMSGTVMAPNIIVKTETTTAKQLLANGAIEACYQTDDGTRSMGDNLTFATEFENKLATWEAGFILDIIYQYTQQYFTGNDAAIRVDQNGEFYTIVTSMDNFLAMGRARGNITRDERERVILALIPQDKNRAGLLENVTFITKSRDEKKLPYYLTMKFIFATKIAGTIRQKPGIMVDYYSPDLFELKISAKVFKYIRCRDEITSGKGKGKVGAGFINIPSYLQIKISKSLDTLELSSDSVPRVVRNREYYRIIALYLIKTWHVGSAKRRYPMSISYNDMYQLGYVASNAKKPQRRLEVLNDIKKILISLVRDGEAFAGCTGVRVAGSQIIMDVAP